MAITMSQPIFTLAIRTGQLLSRGRKTPARQPVVASSTFLLLQNRTTTDAIHRSVTVEATVVRRAVQVPFCIANDAGNRLLTVRTAECMKHGFLAGGTAEHENGSVTVAAADARRSVEISARILYELR